MSRRCTICDHAERDQIDRALVRGAPFRHIAAQYGLSTGALQRHKAEHLPTAMVQARQVGDVINAGELVAFLTRSYTRTEQIFQRADAAGNDKLALMAIREGVRVLAVALRAVETLEVDRRLAELEERL